jgi:hypothetical protein
MDEQEKLALIMHLAHCQRCRERANEYYLRCRTSVERANRLSPRRGRR